MNLPESEKERIILLRRSIEFAPVGICMFRREDSEHAVMIAANDKYLRLIGGSREKLLWSDISGLAERTHPEDRARRKMQIQVMLENGGDQSGTFRIHNEETNGYAWYRIDSTEKDEGIIAVHYTKVDSLVLDSAPGNLDDQDFLRKIAAFPAPVAVYRGDGNDDYMPFVTCSDELCNMVGATLEEVREAYSDAVNTLFPEDRPEFLKYYQKHPDHGTMSLRLVKPDGDFVWARFSYSPFFSGGIRYYYVLYSNITSIKEQEEELLRAKEQESRLREALNEKLITDNELLRKVAMEGNDFIATVDIKTDTMTLVAGHWFGGGDDAPVKENTISCVKMADLMANSYLDTVEERESFMRTYDRKRVANVLDAEGEIILSAKYINGEGKTRYRQYRGTWLDRDKGQMLFVGTDITKSVELETRRQAELEKALEDAQRANAAKSEFLSRISHDIRTPIGAILNLTDFAKKDQKDPERLAVDLEKIGTSGRFLLSLINDVLDIAKIDSGKIELHPEPYAFHEYLSEIRNIVEPMCEEKGQECVVEVENPPFEYAYLDKVRINQVTLNILSNAVKYTPRGGRVVFRTHFHMKDDNRMVFDFEVEDNGIGMSEEFQKHIFEEFAQETDNPLRKEAEASSGTGLGLPIVKKLIDLMGGEIEIHSRRGEGTRVKVQLTMDTSEDLTNAEPAENVADTEKVEGRILFAEDNEINAMIAERIFEEIGVQADHAGNGEAAVQMFEASKPGDYMAVFMDIQMPKMNGYEASAAIRKLEREDAETIPIIAVTADAFTDAMEKAKVSGMNQFTTKPLKAEELRRILKEIAESRKG